VVFPQASLLHARHAGTYCGLVHADGAAEVRPSHLDLRAVLLIARHIVPVERSENILRPLHRVPAHVLQREVRELLDLGLIRELDRRVTHAKTHAGSIGPQLDRIAVVHRGVRVLRKLYRLYKV
jgi:hypothetical protein